MGLGRVCGLNLLYSEGCVAKVPVGMKSSFAPPPPRHLPLHRTCTPYLHLGGTSHKQGTRRTTCALPGMHPPQCSAIVKTCNRANALSNYRLSVLMEDTTRHVIQRAPHTAIIGIPGHLTNTTLLVDCRLHRLMHHARTAPKDHPIKSLVPKLIHSA